MMGILRMILAVVAGFAVVTAVVMGTTFGAIALLDVGDDPTPAYLALNLAGSALAGVLGGWVAARIGSPRAALSAAILAGILFLLTLPTAVGGARGQPGWYPWVLLVLGPTTVLLGGWLHTRGSVPQRPGAASEP